MSPETQQEEALTELEEVIPETVGEQLRDNPQKLVQLIAAARKYVKLTQPHTLMSADKFDKAVKKVVIDYARRAGFAVEDL